MRFFIMLVFVALLALATGCKEKEPPKVQEKRKYAGSLEVLNSCGEVGSAAKMTSLTSINSENTFSIIIYLANLLWLEISWALSVPGGQAEKVG